MWHFLAVCGFVQVVCRGFLVREAWVGVLVELVELDFFSLECNEVFTELYRGEKEEEGDINYLKLLLTQESVKWNNRIFSVNQY